MIFNETNAYTGSEILASDNATTINVVVKGTAVVKAGTPLTFAGEKPTAETEANGILLYDVDPAIDPNGALVVIGVINARRARQHSGAKLVAADIKAAIPGVVLNEKTPLI